MGRVELSEAVFENLLQQLVNLEEDKLNLIKRFSATPVERDGLSSLLDRYIAGVDAMIGQSDRSELAGEAVPFVVIHSEVELQQAESRKVFRIYIVGPLDDEVNDGCVSCLSPLGSALLLKEVGEEVTVAEPGGALRYRVKSARMK